MFKRIRRKLGSLLVLTMLLTAVYSPYAQAAQGNGYSSLWNYIGRGWELQDEGQETVKAAWVCDDEITENGKDTWYLIDENGLLITDRLIHVTYDGTDGYYLINQNNDGHFGCMLYEDGVFDGVNVQFSHDHDGSFGRIRDPRAIEELKKRFPVREVSFLTKSSENRYTSVIRSRLRAASEEDQYDNTEEVSDRTNGEVHIHHYDEGEITREPDCLIKGVRVYTCEECGSTRAEYIGKTPHVYPASPSEAVEPDCTSDGCSLYICEVCGRAKVTVTEATGHSFDEENICTVCGEGKEEEHTHVFEKATPSDHVKEPTCGEDGLERLCCECGAYRLEIVPATGLHEWGDGIINEETNAEEYTCVVCGEGRTVPLEDVSFTVSFDLNYDTEASAPAAQTVKYKRYAEEPERPEREGYTFAGWNEDPKVDYRDRPYSFERTAVTEDKDLYAVWMENTVQLSDGTADRYYIECIITSELILRGMDTEDILLSDDYDGDGLTLEEEYELDTSPFSKDTDEDGLSDYDEVREYGTNPLKKDTDGDGLSDGKEVEYGSDPLTAETEFDVSTEFNDEKEINASVSIEGLTGEQADSLTVEKLEDDPLLPSDMPGYIDDGYDFSMDGTFEKAELKFRFDESLLSDPDFVPAIYYFDEEAQKLEALETAVEGNVATAETSHFSTYILLNSTDFEKAFQPVPLETPNFSTESMVLTNGETGEEIVWKFFKLNKDTENVRYYVDDNPTALAWAAYPEGATVQNIVSNAHIERIAKKGGKVSRFLDHHLSGETESLRFYLENGNYLSVDYCAMYINPELSGDTTDLSFYLGDGTYLFRSRSAYGVSGTCTGIYYGNGHFGTIQFDYRSDKNSPYSVDNFKIYGCGYLPFQTRQGYDSSYEETDTLFKQWLTGGKAYKKTDFETDTDEDDIPDLFEDSVTLFNGTTLVLDKNNSDTDGDGLEDGEEIELDYDYSADGKKVKVTGKMYSDPTREDTDGDSLRDSTDPNPMKFDCVVIDSTDESITFNSGRVWKKLLMTAQEWYLDIQNPPLLQLEKYQAAQAALSSNKSQSFSKEELRYIAIMDSEGAKVYMHTQVSPKVRIEIFESIYGRESKYYKRQGILWSEKWVEVPKNSYYQYGEVVSEADLELTMAKFTYSIAGSPGVEYKVEVDISILLGSALFTNEAIKRGKLLGGLISLAPGTIEGLYKSAFEKALNNWYSSLYSGMQDLMQGIKAIPDEYYTDGNVHIIEVDDDDIKELHYQRNELNILSAEDLVELKIDPNRYSDKFENGYIKVTDITIAGDIGRIQENWNGNVPANCHQFKKIDGKDNKKYVDKKTGHLEVIYHDVLDNYEEDEDARGAIDTYDADIGTYNFAPSEDKENYGNALHFYFDMVPWFLYGNTDADSTDMAERLAKTVGL